MRLRLLVLPLLFSLVPVVTGYGDEASPAPDDPSAEPSDEERDGERGDPEAAYAALPSEGPRPARLQAYESFLRQVPDAPQAEEVRARYDELVAQPFPVPSINEGHTNAVTSVAVSRDGNWALTGSWDNTAKLWRLDGEGDASEAGTLDGHSDWVTSVAFCPDGDWALTGSRDNTAKLWRLDGEGGASEARTLEGHSALVHSVAFSPDGRWALTGSRDRTARLWRLPEVAE